MPRKQEIDLEDEEPPTIEPYTTLGIEKTATADEVKSAYRRAALKHHPGMRFTFPSTI
jgi:DnaJ family protein C protein 9